MGPKGMVTVSIMGFVISHSPIGMSSRVSCRVELAGNPPCWRRSLLAVFVSLHQV